MRVADLIALRLVALGVRRCFSVTGGGAMHLNDAFGEAEGLACTYLHHEQACAMAAEGYARIAGGPALLCVTSGPGAINALNGVFGAFTDSIPLLVVSGQVRTDTLVEACPQLPLRQLGDQEARSPEFLPAFVKRFVSLRAQDDPIAVVDALWQLACSGRPGPVWLEVPVNLQGQQRPELEPALTAPPPLLDPGPAPAPAELDQLFGQLTTAERPLLLLGTGVRLAGAIQPAQQLAEALGVPVLTAWSHDVFANDHPLFVGRPGTIGTRAGNLALQACDLLLVIGSRLNIRQVSYNWAELAPLARIVMVDIDPAEPAKPYLRLAQAIHADARRFCEAMLTAWPAWQDRLSTAEPQRAAWCDRCLTLRASREPRPDDYPERAEGCINPYHLLFALDEALPDDARVVCGDATACIVPFQLLRMQGARRMFSNSGCASMGYDLPAALGAATAAQERGLSGPTVALAGDGSLMMNLQEMQSLAASRLNLCLLVLDNGGYLSIRQTQSNFFGREHGASPASGVSFPDFARLAEAFGLPVIRLERREQLAQPLPALLAAEGPRVAVVRLDPAQEFEPRLKSRAVGGGIHTPALDDMHPPLPESELQQLRSWLQGVAA
ncbi:MAG: thiamine pyrophosphate-binding protein [Synechococcus sp.]